MPRINVKDKRKQQLMQATMDSIAKRGLSETTITHISKGAGMSRGIINFYFTSKEQMLRETLAYLIEEYESVWQTATDKVTGDAKAKLEALLSAHFSKKLCNAKRLNVLAAFWAHAASHEPYREQLDKSDSKLCAAMGRYLADMGKKDAAALVGRTHALIRGFWLEDMLKARGAESQNYVAAIFDALEVAAAPAPAPAKAAAPAKPAPAPQPKAKPTVVKIAKKKPKKAKDVMDGQMDIEDLFAAS